MAIFEYRFSVSEVVSAFECEMHFYLKKKGFNVNFYYGSSNVGTLVHKVLDRFAKDFMEPSLFTAMVSTDNLSSLDKFIVEKLYSILYYEAKEAKNINKSHEHRKLNADFELAWKQLEAMAVYFLEYFLGRSSEEITNAFMYSEKHFELPIIDSVIISGKFDLLMKVQDSIKLIDYKTRSEDIENDIIQLTLYKLGIERSIKKSVTPSVLYISKSEVQEISFSDEEVEEVLKQIKLKVAEMIDCLEGKRKPIRMSEPKVCQYCSARKLKICSSKDQ